MIKKKSRQTANLVCQASAKRENCHLKTEFVLKAQICHSNTVASTKLSYR